MQLEKAVTRSLSIVDRALRGTFPTDYPKRCLYAAFGIQALLLDLGHDASIQGGDAVAFMVSRSGSRASMQGFAGASEGQAHYWVVVSERLVDIGPHYLPEDSSFLAAPVPMVFWDLKAKLPTYLRYRALEDFGTATSLVATDEIHERMDAFIAQCRRKSKQQLGQPKLPMWLLTSQASVELNAARGDAWAKGALRFASMSTAQQGLPF